MPGVEEQRPVRAPLAPPRLWPAPKYDGSVSLASAHGFVSDRVGNSASDDEEVDERNCKSLVQLVNGCRFSGENEDVHRRLNRPVRLPWAWIGGHSRGEPDLRIVHGDSSPAGHTPPDRETLRLAAPI